MTGIYKILNKVNGKIYIGQSIEIEHRWKVHISSTIKSRDNMIIHKAMRKYGIEYFEFTIIWTGSKELLNEMEIYFIKEYKSFRFSKEYDGSNGYNMNIGGGGNNGRVCSEETKEKMRGKKRSEETKEKMRIANKGKIMSNESKEKMRIAKKGKVSSYDKNIYNFQYIDGTIFTGTQIEFRNKFKFDTISRIVTGRVKKYKGWKLYNN